LGDEKMQFIRDYKEKIFLCFFSVLLITIYVQNINRVYLPFVFNDELGYWGNAAYMIGYDWSDVMKGIAYYSYGYSFFLVPLLKLFSDPIMIYRSAIILNIIFVILGFFVNYKIFKRLFSKANPILCQLCAFCFSCYSSYLIQSKIAWPETLLMLIFSVAVLLFIQLHIDAKIWRFIAFGACVCYAYMVHQRMLGVLVSAILIIFCMLCLKRITVRQFFSFAATCVICLVLSNFLKEDLINNLYGLSGEIVGNDFSSQLEKVKLLFTFSGIKSLIKALSGQIFYLGAATFLLFYIGTYKLLAETIKWIKSIIKKKLEPPSESHHYDEVYFFLLLSTIFTIIISAIFMIKPVRIDHLVYGRYNETLVAVISGTGMMALIENKKKYLKPLIGSVLVFACTFLITKYTFEIGSFENFNVLNAVSLSNNYYRTNISYALGVTIIVSIIILGSIFYRRRNFLVVPFILCICYFFYNSNQTLKDFLNGHEYNVSIAELLNYIPSDQVKSVFLKTENSERYRGSIQFLFQETPLISIDKEEVENDMDNMENSYLISSNLDPVIFNKNQILDLKVNAASRQLFYSHKNVANESGQQLNIDLNALFINNEEESILMDRFLAYGPYITLSEGEYTLNYEISLTENTQDNIGHIDIYSNSSRIAYQELVSKDVDKETSTIITLPFRLVDETTNIEFRLFANAGTQIKITSVTIIKMD